MNEIIGNVMYHGHWPDDDKRSKCGIVNPDINQVIDENGNDILSINGMYLHHKYSDQSCSDENIKFIVNKRAELGKFIQDAINEKLSRERNEN